MNDFKRFSYDESARGFAATVVSCVFLSWWGVLNAVLCGILWMLGGTYNKFIRRWGVPATCLLFATITNGFQWWYLLGFVVGVVILYQGDGFPDHQETTKDAGSWMGRWVEKYIDDRDYIGGPITKWIWVFVFWFSQIPYLFHQG